MSEEQYKSDDATKLASDVFAGKLTVEEALKRLRTRLLDLSMRNRLLNYRHPKGRSVQFVGRPDLDLMYERLKEDGKSVTVSYVPDPPPLTYAQGKKPDARQQAASAGIDASTEFPEPAAGGAYRRVAPLQSLMYPADLEKFLRKLSSEAHTVVEETGTNMLYLMFGFLEFYDSEDSDRPLLAPLVSMPVTLEKGSLDHESRTYRYEVAYSGEDVIENFTLREKLKEFHLQLPEFDEYDSPETYFAKIQQAISKRRNWRVRRRLSIGFLSFGKLAIWADLDPAKVTGLLSNPLLRNVFEGGNVDPSDAFHAEDYVVDKHHAAELPLIYDADSSQHSAIIDVLDGKNLVINGPPGTGKSQTITNVIAAAMAAGKKVLFVSEKLAALEVVKRRLEKAGLGEFCLELHSNKSLKKQLLEGLAERIKRRFAAPAGYASQVEVLRERRRTLNTYAELLGSRHGNQLDLTVHEVFWAAERRRSQLRGATEVVSDISLAQAKDWTAEEVDRRRMVTMSVAAAAIDLGCPVAESPWSGFAPNLLVRGDELPIVEGLRRALEHANALSAAASGLHMYVGRDSWSIAQLQKLNEALDQLSLDPDVAPWLLESMYGGKSHDVPLVKNEAARLVQSLSRLRKLAEIADAALLPGATTDGSTFERLRTGAARALAPGSFEKTAQQLLGWSHATLESIEAAIALQSSDVTSFCRDHDRALEVLQGSIRGYESLGCLHQSAEEVGVATTEALATCRSVDAILQQVQAVLAPAGINVGGRVDDVQGLLDGRGYGELLTGALISPEVVDTLNMLCEEGLGEWTAERFTSASKDLMEDVGAAESAVQGLKEICSKVGLPFDTTTTGLEAVDALLVIAEQAPVELLSHRSKTFATQEFAEAAVQAEESHRSLQRMSANVQDHFHVDTLPDVSEIRNVLRVFRRGDAFFNFLKSDWRAARATFKDCCKDQRKFKAKDMEERMALVLKWKQATTDYEGSDLYRAKLGSLFEGLRTDYAKIRRLHEWYRASAQSKLQHWPLGECLDLTSVPEGHLSALAAQAPRIRAWAKTLAKTRQFPASLPGMDPALASIKRADEIVPHLFTYAQRATTTAALLRQAARPGTGVARVRDLAALRLRVQANSAPFTSLLVAPMRLAAAAQRVGLEDMADPREDFQGALEAVREAGERAAQIGRHVAATLGPRVDPLSAQRFLSSVSQLKTHVGLHAAPVPVSKAPRDWAELFTHYRTTANAASALAQTLIAQARADATVEQAVQGVHARLQAVDALRALEEDEDFKRRFGGVIQGTSTDEKALRSCLAWADAVTSLQPKLAVEVADALLCNRAPAVLDGCQRLAETATREFSSYERQMRELEGVGAFDWSEWGGSPAPSDAVSRLERALAGSDVLVAWSKFLAAKEDANSLGLSLLLQRVERGRLRPEELVAAFDFVFYRSLAKSIVSSNRVLARFSGAGHDQLRKEFADLDKGLITLNGAEYASRIDKEKKVRIGVNSGRAGDLTEMSLITREINKQRKHIPIRQLLKRAGTSIQELKPCFMMGPLSVAQYLEQGHLKFDLVVMDEASQLRPEDALGAVARGSQIVVVGDPKQLPPTNFFDRLMDGDDEEGDDAAAVTEGVESILGICEQLYRPVRTLRWHYRSQHESLIAFSNHQFYGGGLVVFPSPYKRNRRLGVVYRHVKDGIYQDRKNLPEANRLVDAAIEHMLTSPTESLGVVTLNQTQRELIEDLFDQKMRLVKGVSEYLQHHENAGWKFFIKNLENVQGDERDVIFVSTTFGKPPGASAVRQNFGPINRADGWRRLNVLFTRSRRRLEVFTSMLPGDIQVDERTPLGRKALRDYLEYARSGALPAPAPEVGDRAPDSDFEVAVAEALQHHGYECDPQVGVAGYFIDIGVRNPDRRGEFLVGIECDGATYHSSLSARDRDRIRQEILESLGWRGRILRIWSTDWFSDPRGQTARVLQFLTERRAVSSAEVVPFADDDFAVFEESEDGPAIVSAQPPTTLSSDFQTSRSGIDDAFVEVGDRVTYVMLEVPDERHTIQIVDSPSNVRLGIVNENTPVAQALLGLGNGEDGHVEVPGQPVRRVRVIKIHRDSEALPSEKT